MDINSENIDSITVNICVFFLYNMCFTQFKLGTYICSVIHVCLDVGIR